ncbi:3-deoxy-D-manno-octulosonic acid transferase [Rubrivivax benzoatilyticus]|uniref:3-deoxy-D-manno-octulosonic acid transferase n=1 Tax=Rubrivivax benzoatilyticus TaxID=316997 RepID=UPI0006803F79|nr:glycosyltransferase N-terminal domain-containing protein [Rubrivivax benzoatilyticus]
MAVTERAWRARYAALRVAETLSDLRGNAAGPVLGDTPPPRQPAWWAFVSTIGELHSTAPLLAAVQARLPGQRMVLVTDHEHYVPSYRARFPEADVVHTRGHSRDAKRLAGWRPPALVVVAEIPLLPGDAPCRCSAALLLEARAAGARLVAVNGWLYGDTPPSRMDRLERRLLGPALLGQYDTICVQAEAQRNTLVAHGAAPDRTHVVGNLKLDALRSAAPLPAQPGAALLRAVAAAGRPVVVAGSLTRQDEESLLLDAFVELRRQRPGALLVVAPRHPEVVSNLERLDGALARRGLQASRRSALREGLPAEGFDVLVLDTIGELRGCYADADVAHVGVDHNVLEPLLFGKPTTVSGRWCRDYPSYPVFRRLSDAGALQHAADAGALARAWDEAIAGRLAGLVEAARRELGAEPSSLERHLAALEPVLSRLA